MDKETKSNVVFVVIIAAIVGGLVFGWSDIQWFRFDTAARVILSTEGIGTHPTPEVLAGVEEQIRVKASEFGFEDAVISVTMEKRASSLGTTFWYVIATVKSGSRSFTRELQLDRENYEREDLDYLREKGIDIPQD